MSIEAVRKYTRPGAVVPVDMETTRLLVDALRQAIAESEKKEPWVKTYCGGKPNYTTPEQEPVAWREVAGKTTQYYDYNEDGRGEPLYAAPVHSIDMIQECVDETAKHRHDEDWYGQWQWQCGYERGRDKGYEAGWDNRGKEEKNNWVGLTDDELKEISNLWKLFMVVGLKSFTKTSKPN